MPRRSKPMLVAPLIPFLSILGIFGLQSLHGSRYLAAFVIVWCLVMAALTAYIIKQAIGARAACRKAPDERSP